MPEDVGVGVGVGVADAVALRDLCATALRERLLVGRAVACLLLLCEREGEWEWVLSEDGDAAGVEDGDAAAVSHRP